MKSLDKALEAQTEYAKSAYETFVAELQKIAGLYTDLAKQTFKPLEGLVAKFMPAALMSCTHTSQNEKPGRYGRAFSLPLFWSRLPRDPQLRDLDADLLKRGGDLARRRDHEEVVDASVAQ